jgi:hypothetical protein
MALGVLADLLASHRVVSQRTLERVRRIELELGIPPSHYVSPPPASEREAAEPQPDPEDRELVVTTVSMAGDPD